MSGRTVAVVAAVLMTFALGACAEEQPTEKPVFGGDSSTRVDVATPDLVELKAEAGIADCPRGTRTPDEVDDGLPAVTLPCLGGGRDVDLSTLRGEPMVINLWASWCGPCRRELPHVQALHETGKVRVLGVDFDDPAPGRALSIAAEAGVTYPSVADTDLVLKEPLRVIGLPATAFVDADGRIVATVPKELKSYAELAGLVREHLGVDL